MPIHSRMPIHIGITVEGTSEWAEKNGFNIQQAYKKRIDIVKEMMRLQTQLKIPVITFYIMPAKRHKPDLFPLFIDYLAEFFESLNNDMVAHEHKTKISVLGKWYDLPSRIVDPVKRIIAETKDYDRFFVNFCINYDGQDEIVDACKIIAMRVKADKIDIDSISKEMIKEGIYSSFIMPLDLLIKTGNKKTTDGFLMWDSKDAVMYFSDVLWPEFTEGELLKALDYYSKNKL